MTHEALPANEARDARYAEIVAALADARPMHIISAALKTGAPNHMIDAQLPNLWRY